MNTEPKKISEKTSAIFRDAVFAITAKDKNHGWNQQDSLGAIDNVVAEQVGLAVAGGEDMTKWSLSPDAVDAIGMFINPSQCRQRLEDWLVINKSTQKRAKAVNPFAMAMQ